MEPNRLEQTPFHFAHCVCGCGRSVGVMSLAPVFWISGPVLCMTAECEERYSNSIQTFLEKVPSSD